jgi:hypothetical protein
MEQQIIQQLESLLLGKMLMNIKVLKFSQILTKTSGTANSPGVGRLDLIQRASFQSCGKELRDDYGSSFFYNHPDLKVEKHKYF